MCFCELAGDSFDHLALRSATKFPTFLFAPGSLFCHGSFLTTSPVSSQVWLHHLKRGWRFFAWRGSKFSSSLPLPVMVLPAEVPMDTSTCLTHMALAGTSAKPAPTLSGPRANRFSKLQSSVHRHQVFQKLLALNSILKS